MIKFNQELQNYKSKNFGIITIDKTGTNRKNDAYSIDKYDDNHFFVGVYITNPFFLIKKENLVNSALLLRRNEFYVDYINKYLSVASLGQERKNNVFAFKFLINLNGDIMDFSINKEEIEIDYELDEEDVEYLFESDNDDLKDEEISLVYMLEAMHTISDLIYMNRKKKNNAEDRDLNKSFATSFYIQFLDLVNIYVPKLFEKERIPLLYHNTEKLDTNMDTINAYYSPEFRENEVYGEPIGKFTSPLWDTVSVINLAILDDLVFDKYGLKEYKALEWKDKIENIKIVKMNKSFYRQTLNKYYRKRKYESRRF